MSIIIKVKNQLISVKQNQNLNITPGTSNGWHYNIMEIKFLFQQILVKQINDSSSTNIRNNARMNSYPEKCASSPTCASRSGRHTGCVWFAYVMSGEIFNIAMSESFVNGLYRSCITIFSTSCFVIPSVSWSLKQRPVTRVFANICQFEVIMNDINYK